MLSLTQHSIIIPFIINSNPIRPKKTHKNPILVFAQKSTSTTTTGSANNGNGGDDNGNNNKRPPSIFNNIKFGDLLNPDPDNIVAVGLTGLLTWASVQVLSQLLFISFAIVVAALKYSFVAALLLFILITLL
ncbi:hypothetical protein ACFE04_009816 [Oxalis oulophora]